MPQAAAPTSRRDDLPLADRRMELRAFQRAADSGADAPLATAKLVFTTGAPVRRYDWYRERVYMERLMVEEGSIRLGRLQSGAPLLNTHSSWSLEDQLGVVENPQIRDGAGECDVTFSRRESVAGYVRDVQDRIVRNVSVGYVRHRMEMVPPAEEGGVWEYRVTDWEPYEVSLVPIPADAGSQVRSAGNPGQAADHAVRTFACECVELVDAQVRTLPEQSRTPSLGTSATRSEKETTMTPEEQAAQEAAQREQAQAEATRAAQAAAEQARQAEQQRTADITELCARHGVAHLAAGMIRAGNSLDQARTAVLEEMARRDAAAGGHRNIGEVRTITDEVQTRMAGMEQAILHRVAPVVQLDDNGRQFRGMSLLELGREFLEMRGVSTRGMDRMTLATRTLNFRGGMMGTSDFANLFANVANKRLRSAYDENPGTYAVWARRAPNAPDFKQMNVVQLGAAPDLLKTNEHGEFTVGSMADGKEVYSVLTYGRIVSLTRQAIVNDDLRGFDRLITAFGFSARRLENRLVYAQLTANAALADGVALFHASHGNLAGSGAAIDIASLSAGRAAMRKQKGLQNEELNITPAYLIVPAALEQVAYQYTSANYVPATAATINEFRAGGRTAVEPVVEPLLDANSASAWYLASSSGQIDTVEYCYLDGAEGPVIETEMGFEVDGVSYKCREDFATKAIDYRGLYKNPGA